MSCYYTSLVHKQKIYKLKFTYKFLNIVVEIHLCITQKYLNFIFIVQSNEYVYDKLLAHNICSIIVKITM